MQRVRQVLKIGREFVRFGDDTAQPGPAAGLLERLIRLRQKFELDLEYVCRCSFLLDLRILSRTIGSLIRREGIAREGHATAPEFMGRALDG